MRKGPGRSKQRRRFPDKAPNPAGAKIAKRWAQNAEEYFAFAPHREKCKDASAYTMDRANSVVHGGELTALNVARAEKRAERRAA